jgi:phosphate transport system substrate-binding protein
MPSLRLPRSVTPALLALLLVPLCSPALGAEIMRLTGAGASFPAPLYQRWFRDYHLAHPEVQPDYQAIGSGAGIAGLIQKRLDFAGSDVHMSAEDAARVEGGVVQVPVTAGAVVLAYNLPGIDGLKLSREAVAGIFLGKVQRWNDPVIQAANPGVKLPDTAITVVARSDSSGTTYVITRHLSAISEEFRQQVGTTMTPVWPQVLKQRGGLIRGQGNGGVAAHVKTAPGAIGYVQYGYAHLGDMQVASLQNQAGEFIAPSSDSFRAAVESFRAGLDRDQVADPRGAASYPILTVSWLIARKSYDHKKAEAMRAVVRYVLTEGQKVAELLGYIPLTEQAVGLLMQQVDFIE